MAERGSVHVGTSGWVYKHWRGTFYPEDLPQTAWFGYYAERFDTVEINNTFYRMPSEGAVEAWRDAAPRGFVYSFKGSRYVTHRKKLLPGGKYPHGERDLVDRLRGVGASRLACVLWQLPPRWNVDVDRVRAFLKRLPQREKVRYAFEFRDASWYTDEVLSALGEHGVAFCIHDWPDAPTPIEVTADLVYVRFHGHTSAYADEYGPGRLRPWVARIRAWQRQGRDVLVYFNNDQSGFATRDARWLAEALGVAKRAEAETPPQRATKEGSPRRAAMP